MNSTDLQTIQTMNTTDIMITYNGSLADSASSFQDGDSIITYVTLMMEQCLDHVLLLLTFLVSLYN